MNGRDIDAHNLPHDAAHGAVAACPCPAARNAGGALDEGERARLGALLDDGMKELRLRQAHLDVVLEATKTGLWQWDPTTRESYIGPTHYAMLGWDSDGVLPDQETWSNLVHPDDRPVAHETFRDVARSAEDITFSHEYRMRSKHGQWRWILTRGKIVDRDADGRVRRIVGVNTDVTERKRGEFQERLRNDVLEKLARGAELPALLDAIVRGIEAAQPGAIASVLLVDDEGRLRMGAAPSLPDDLCARFDGMAIGDGAGSCGTAAYRRERVIVADIGSHPYWACCRDLAAQAGVAACWSQPVIDSHGRIVATVAMYGRRPSQPDDHEVAVLEHAANLASIAVERYREEKQLRMAMLALEHTRESVYWLDDYGRMLYVNPAAECELGRSVVELRQMAMSDIDPNMPATVWGPDGELTRRLDAHGLRKFVSHHRRRDGRLIPVEIDSDPFTYDGRRYFIAISRDISDRQAAAEALRQSEAKFSAMFHLTPEPMALTRLMDGCVLEVSRSYAEYFGYTRGEVLGRSTLPGDLGVWCSAEQRRHWAQQLECDGEVVGFETPLRRKDGSLVTVMISGKVIEIAGAPCVIVDIHDITEQKRHEEQLKEIAHHDPLTKLPNRILLGDRLRQAIAHSRRAGTRVAICYLDLDGFKAINDALGHHAGDRLLVAVADRLLAAVRSADTVARLGGDEFVLLLSGLTDDDECRTAIDRLLMAVSAPYPETDGEGIAISASIGVTVFPNDAADPDTLVRHADHAMYAAKQAGKNRYDFFDMPLEQGIEARHAARQRLGQALAEKQFRLYYQPKVDCRAGRVLGAEALIRWQHPTQGLLSPAEFMPLIEDDPLAIAFGDWAIREALRQMTLWLRDGLDLRISVNAFARQLLEPGFAERVAHLLAEHPEVPADRLQIEIVESTALEELDAVRAVISACGELGVDFALDDLGTGYSSLVYLRHLPAREIKIDQSFVRNMLTSVEDLAIVEAVIGLGRAFRLSVIAEGAETPAHIGRLIELGCDVLQGYALARPMAAAALPRWVREFRPDPAWQATARGA
ncbi:MAG: EAL domain-containing protein [Rhodocyclaceae bacterium]|nr:EAL domain-containing protein [Rhodocyclaceae bacterium]